VDNVREFTFGVIADSFREVDGILAADRAAAAGRDAYDDEYFAKFFASVQPVLEKRISGAIAAAGSIITSAWVQAGKPALPVTAPHAPPRPIRRH
jgi:hypothetical protein